MSNLAYAGAIGLVMVATGDLRAHWWLIGSLAWGVIGIPITRRWERQGQRPD